jgi:nitroreductase
MSTSYPPLDSAALLSALKWRYATKRFDPAKKISPENWKTLEEALVLTPSSFGLQPWKFLVIQNPDLRAKLRPHANDQPQATDASHYVVFAILKNMRREHVERYVARVAEVRRQSLDSLANYQEHIVGGIIDGYRSLHVNTWASNQTFIALGQLLVSAALLKIDACPMEGFDKRAYGEILGLGKRGLSAVVTCALGYRLDSDKYAQLTKVRFEAKDVIEYR